MCMFHGNRVRELLQLVASDITVVKGVLVITFQEELRGESSEDEAASVSESEPITKRRLKNRWSQRVVPAHPALVELGLEQFVEHRRKTSGQNALLFPSSTPETGGKSPKIGRAYEQSYLRFVRDKLGFGHGFGNHSYRHLVEDRIRDAQARNGTWPPGLPQQYMGRKTTREKDRSVTAELGSEALYGKGYEPVSMLRWIKQIDFSDVTLPPRYTDWLSKGKS